MDSRYIDIVELFKSGVNEVKPDVLLGNSISLNNNEMLIKNQSGRVLVIDLSKYDNVIVIGAGKATAAMAKKLEEILEAKITSGTIVSKYGFKAALKVIDVLEASHPVPDENGMKGAQAIVNICKKATENDLIINLLSGGASALLPLPVEGVSLEEKQAVTSDLLDSGASIDEINIIRRHLSDIKGGGLLKYIYPADLVTMVISDVIGDKIDIIGSGITYPAERNIEDFNRIVEKYNLSGSTIDFVRANAGKTKETKIVSDEKLEDYKASNLVLGNNTLALSKIKQEAEKLGYETVIVTSELEGEASEVGEKLVEDAVDFRYNKAESGKKYCFLYAGETTVTIKGKGKGGRNQEMVLAAARALEGTDGITFLSGGTDGNDGPTDAAGAVCDGTTLKNGDDKYLDINEYLDNNDSYHYFKETDELLLIGPSGTNVMDVQIVLIDATLH
ncbi:MAG: DUF4147 domain-containing protein [Bacteroidota bacterium]